MEVTELLLVDACEELESLASKWEDLGHRLKISDETIQELKSKEGAEQDCLSKVLSIWKCTTTTESDKSEESPTWERLLECVEKLDQELAATLKRKYGSIAEASVDVGRGDGAGGEEVGEDEIVKEKMDKVDTAGVRGSEKGGQVETLSDAHIFSESWSKLQKDELIDRIRGTIYGQAIGDALGMTWEGGEGVSRDMINTLQGCPAFQTAGLATEFMNKREANVYYKKGLSYDVIVQDFHRSRYSDTGTCLSHIPISSNTLLCLLLRALNLIAHYLPTSET